jgi:hypothetical protein
MQASDQDIIKAAADLKAELEQPRLEAFALDPAELCKTYSKVKGSLEVLLPAIGLIPVYGAPVASAVKMLMNIANKLCPTE